MSDRERHRDRTAEGCAGSHRAHHLQRSGVRRSVAVDLRDDARHRSPDRGDRDRCREPAAGVRARADRRRRVAPRRRRARRVPHGRRAQRQREGARSSSSHCSARRSRRSSTGRRASCCSRRSRTSPGSSPRSNLPLDRRPRAPCSSPRKPMSAAGCSGNAGPPLPPPVEVDAQDIAVVSGEYPEVAWRLVDAEEEAAALVQRYQRVGRRTRSSTTVIDCLKGQPPADVLHFAVHGTYAPEGVLEGLILIDGERLDPMVVKGCAFAARAVRVPQRVSGRQRQRGARRLLGHGRGVPARGRGRGRRAAVVDRRRRGQGPRVAVLPARLRRRRDARRPCCAKSAARTPDPAATARRRGSHISTSDIPG